MSGSGHSQLIHQGILLTLTQAIQREIHAWTWLLTRRARLLFEPCKFEPNLVYYPVEIQVPNGPLGGIVRFGMPLVRLIYSTMTAKVIVDNPRGKGAEGYRVFRLPLFSQAHEGIVTPKTVEGFPLGPNMALVQRTPTLVSSQRVKQIPILKPKGPKRNVYEKKVLLIGKPKSLQLNTAPPQYNGKVWRLQGKIQTKSHMGKAGPVSTPWKKVPIPSHRFKQPVKEFFRKKLAEKHGTFPGNIRILRIYGKMQMDLYQSIVPDDQGILKCEPKLDLLKETLGKHQAKIDFSASLMGKKMKAETSYLIIGTTVNSKDVVRALIPLSQLQEIEGDES